MARECAAKVSRLRCNCCKKKKLRVQEVPFLEERGVARKSTSMKTFACVENPLVILRVVRLRRLRYDNNTPMLWVEGKFRIS